MGRRGEERGGEEAWGREGRGKWAGWCERGGLWRGGGKKGREGSCSGKTRGVCKGGIGCCLECCTQFCWGAGYPPMPPLPLSLLILPHPFSSLLSPPLSPHSPLASYPPPPFPLPSSLCLGTLLPRQPLPLLTWQQEGMLKDGLQVLGAQALGCLGTAPKRSTTGTPEVHQRVGGSRQG